jgi:chaperonin cofactor prefoldin
MNRFLNHIEAKRAKIQKKILELEDELEKLSYSEQVYRASGAVTERPSREMVVQGTLVPDEHTYDHRVTIRERVIAILRTRPDGLTSSQLLEDLRSAGSPDLSRQTLAPSLTRLKSEDALELAHGVWRIKKHESEGG